LVFLQLETGINGAGNPAVQVQFQQLAAFEHGATGSPGVSAGTSITPTRA
jgi:hypothetical protein